MIFNFPNGRLNFSQASSFMPLIEKMVLRLCAITIFYDALCQLIVCFFNKLSSFKFKSFNSGKVLFSHSICSIMSVAFPYSQHIGVIHDILQPPLGNQKCSSTPFKVCPVVQPSHKTRVCRHNYRRFSNLFGWVVFDSMPLRGLKLC
jgi:hypothetical protein